MGRTTSLARVGIAVFLSLWWCVQFTAPVAAQDRVRARVGIQVRSGERTDLARPAETLKAGDFLRVYVIPEDDAYVYVVHNDGKTPTLLQTQDATTRVSKGTPVVLPAPTKFYQVDGTSPQESITVICSPTELREVASLFSTTPVSQHSWLALEKALLDRSKISLAQKAEKPFQIAGTVRSLGNDSFVETLPISSGKTMVVKKYDFQIQK